MQTKEELYKQRFKKLFFDQISFIKLKINFDNSYIKYFYTKNGVYLGDYDSKNKLFWLSYQNVWSKFNTEFGLNEQEIKELSKGILEDAYNLKYITTLYMQKENCMKLEDAYNLKYITTCRGDFSLLKNWKMPTI